jgi:4-alpha-glucanotransferase
MAKKFFRSWVMQTGLAKNRADVAFLVERLEIDMDEFEEGLKANLKEESVSLWSAEEISSSKESILIERDKLKAKWRKSRDPDDEIQDGLIRARDALAEFKKDKREFLVTYSNWRVLKGSHDWEKWDSKWRRMVFNLPDKSCSTKEQTVRVLQNLSPIKNGDQSPR